MSNNLNVQENISLAPFTTFKIGGNARYFITAETEKEIIDAINFANENDFEIFILGGGSNILVSDDGFDGLVLKIASKGILQAEIDDQFVAVTAQAGEDWDEFVEFCVNKDLAGIECLSGIPGLVGGTPIQNVGAYGQEVSETIKTVRVYDRKSKQVLELSNQDCGFEYRKSIFNTTQKDRFVVLSVVFNLQKNGKAKIAYADLQKHFVDRNPTLAETRKIVRQIRESKGMLVRQGGLDSQSAGSFFKNPIVDKEKYNEIQKIAHKLELIGRDDKVPSFFVDENNVKIPAAWLIEKSGFHKGFQNGKAGLSTCHTLALTNRGNAKAEDILKLKEIIQSKIKELFEIELTPEPNFIGFQN